MSNIYSTTKNKQGFTLVELSIVLVIIGLLIGGILVGQSLIRSTEMKRFVSEINQLTILAGNFKERFRYLPGDLRGSDYFATGCAGNYCDGNQNGGVLASIEGNNFWLHLQLANMLEFKGHGAIYSDDSESVGWGSFANSMKQLNAYYTVLGPESYLRAYGSVDNNYFTVGDYNVASFTIEELYAMETKYDDKIANAGLIRGWRTSVLNYCTSSDYSAYQVGAYSDGERRCYAQFNYFTFLDFEY